MKKVMKKTALLLTLIMCTLCVQLPASAAQTDVSVGIMKYYVNDTQVLVLPTLEYGNTVKSEIKVTGSFAKRTDAVLISALYNSNVLQALQMSQVPTGQASAVLQTSISVPQVEGANWRYKSFIWNMSDSSLTPYAEAVNALQLTATAGVNAVTLNWDAVDGYISETLDVYRDNAKVGTVAAGMGDWVDYLVVDEAVPYTYQIKNADSSRVSNVVSATPGSAQAVLEQSAWISKDDYQSIEEVGTGSFTYVENKSLKMENGDVISFTGYICQNNFSSGTAVPDGEPGYKSPDNQSNVWVMTRGYREYASEGVYRSPGTDGFGLTIDKEKYTAAQNDFTVYVEYWGEKTTPFKFRYYQKAGDSNGNFRDIDFPVNNPVSEAKWKVTKMKMSQIWLTELKSNNFHGTNQLSFMSGNPTGAPPCYIRKIIIVPEEYTTELTRDEALFVTDNTIPTYTPIRPMVDLSK